VASRRASWITSGPGGPCEPGAVTGAEFLLLLLVAGVALVIGLLLGWGAAARREAVELASPAPSPWPEPSAEEPQDSAGELTPDPDLQSRLLHALDSIDQGVILFAADGAELLRNRVARENAEARGPLVLVEAAVQELLAAALAGRSARREVDLFGPPAQSFVVRMLAGPGDRAGALALIEDRSPQRRTETVRRDFVANISHELKTPIGALGLLAETIRDEPDPAVVRRLSERMIAEADRAARTIDDLLELSRIEFGDDTEFERVDVLWLVSEARGRIASAAEHAGITIRIDLPAGVEVVGDRRQLVSAAYNLLDNAVKYSPAGSEVLVQGEPHDDVVRLRFADSGVGIPRRDLDRVFERFYRVDRARSRGTGGTGLGLAIVRHVMSNHGGDVSVESTEGVGSVFTLTLPGAT
jgi:two-component system, OmpR family, sensor histidine kinase SenX3